MIPQQSTLYPDCSVCLDVVPFKTFSGQWWSLEDVGRLKACGISTMDNQGFGRKSLGAIDAGQLPASWHPCHRACVVVGVVSVGGL